jgi:hypothetical protein
VEKGGARQLAFPAAFRSPAGEVASRSPVRSKKRRFARSTAKLAESAYGEGFRLAIFTFRVAPTPVADPASTLNSHQRPVQTLDGPAALFIAVTEL